MKFVTKTLAALALVFGASASMAAVTGTITMWSTNTSGVVWALLSTTGGHAGCAGSSQYWIIKDETSVIGKLQIAQIAAAHDMGQTVTIYGLSTCSRFSGSEDIDSIVTQ